MTERMARLVQSGDYREVARIANGFLHRSDDNSLKHTTIEYRAVSLGESIVQEVKERASETLAGFGIDAGTGHVTESSTIPPAVSSPKQCRMVSFDDEISSIEGFNKLREESAKIKSPQKVGETEASPDDCVYVSIDDIGVKRQKESRGDGYEKPTKYVENTVVHVQSGQSQYYLTCVGMREAFKILLAFLLANGMLEDKRLVFLTDGARNIKDCIEEFFSFRPYCIILDWFHLKKRMQEQMSMALKGKKDEKKQMVKDILRILWAGNTQEAKDYLGSIKAKNIKNKDILSDAGKYIESKSAFVPCYAMRAMKGLRNSSNPVEKANDIIVAQRQKHKGMSWSKKGSGALAAITAICKNGFLTEWIRERTLSLKIAA